MAGGKMTEIKITLFKPSGKYYTEENWLVPDDANGPSDMMYSLDFRRIDGGPVLVEENSLWGYPYLFPAIEEFTVKANRSGIPNSLWAGSKNHSAQVLPPEPMSEQEKFFKALNEGKVMLKTYGNQTTIRVEK